MPPTVTHRVDKHTILSPALASRAGFGLPLRIAILGAIALTPLATRPVRAAELVVLSQENWADWAIKGKEVDGIYGDFALRNDRIVCVIGKPVASRNANMTVRQVGGAIIDLTSRRFSNDQLSAYYPGGGQFEFASPDSAVSLVANEPADLPASGTRVSLHLQSTRGPSGLEAQLSYSLQDGAGFVLVRTAIRNPTDKDVELTLTDALRADRTFQFGNVGDSCFWAYDEWFRQCYGVLCKERRITSKGGRLVTVQFHSADGPKTKIPAGGEIDYVRRVFPTNNLLQVRGAADRLNGKQVAPISFEVADANGPVANAKVTIRANKETLGWARTNNKGRLQFPLAANRFEAEVVAVGRPKVSLPCDGKNITVTMEPCGYLQGRVVDEQGQPLPCKISIHAKEGGTGETPDYGPDSGATSIKNLRYTANGQFRCEVAPGEYRLVISRGPEYDAVFEEVAVGKNETAKIEATLRRSVNTRGWISADFHSHSSPSGDNTGSQFGRVQNLLAEHIEFAPCTEHNRISTYVPHLKRLKAEKWMATCTGMELTGSPLPINHQNAFPLKLVPHTQDNGAPLTDQNPVVQIERLAMWDNNSEKLVQGNHPNLVQMLGDRDLNGEYDGGFNKMFQFMDVLEVHPPAAIFTPPAKAPVAKLTRNPIFHWMQMLNRGYRITGVVNTDAHYNYHESGWIRNYIRSGTDEPAEIKTMDVVRNSEAGHVVMTTGPFLEVVGIAGDKTADPGADLSASDGKVELQVRVQCANWLNINRVQVFANGRPVESLNYTQRGNPELFGSGVVKFKYTIPLTLAEDTHLIVAAVGEGLSLGAVAGPTWGKQTPVAVANPIFVDVDGDGFKPNGDLLGLPIPLE